MIVIVGFLPEDRMANGLYPSPQDLATAVMNAFSGLAPGTWGLVYEPSSIPVPPPAPPPPPPAPKRWRVTSWAANVRSAPMVTPTNIVGGLKQGDVITQLDVSGAWIKFDRGWVSSSILEAV